MRRFQFTAIDDATRVRALNIYEKHIQTNTIDFVDHIIEKFETEIAHFDGAQLSPEEGAIIKDNSDCYKGWQCAKFSKGFTTASSGQPYGPCGLCAIPMLKQLGIEHIKIAGRDGNETRKHRSLEMVNEIVSQVENGTDHNEITFAAISIPDGLKPCENSDMCYYPEVFKPSKKDSTYF